MKLDEIFSILKESDESYRIECNLHVSPAFLRFDLQEIKINNDEIKNLERQLSRIYYNAASGSDLEKYITDLHKVTFEREDEQIQSELNQISDIFTTLLKAKFHEYLQRRIETYKETIQKLQSTLSQNNGENNGS